MTRFGSLSRAAQLYVGGVIAFGVATAALGWAVDPVRPQDALTLLYLGVGTQIAALRPIPWRSGHQSVIDPLLIATGLLVPGGGVATIAWLAVFDGRVPGRAITWWAFLFNRAMLACAYVVPSVAVEAIHVDLPWGLPLKTLVYVVSAVSLNYILTALVVSYVSRSSVLATLFDNVGFTTLLGTAALSFSGGIIWLLLQSKVGYIMAPGLFGFVLAVRGNVTDAQRQTLLKDQTLELAAQALDARDRYTESHSIRVAELAGRLGEQLELGDREVELIRTAGSLHDLGKIGVRDDILNKAGPLSEEEWEIMRRHPDIGADMIAQHSALREVAPLVRHHHERWDGTGYPAGLKGEVIPFGARILSVADSFDTITGTRLYRKSVMTPIEGVEDISRRASHWYDPNVVDALREIHGLKPLDVVDRPDVPRRITTIRVLTANQAFGSLVSATGISAIGDPLTQVATLVTVYAATNDARFVALAFIVQAVATVLVTTALGGLIDRFARRPVVVALDLARAAVLFATPMALAHHTRWGLLFPILLTISAINAIVQPARQASIPNLVPTGQVGKANAIVAAVTVISSAVGFGIAGALLSSFPNVPPDMLFVFDGATFAISAFIVLTIPTLGGGSAAVRISGAFKRSFAIVAARPHLAIGGLAAFLIPISYPALLALAYDLAKTANVTTNGGQLYSVLELMSSVGIFVGSLIMSRFRSIGSMRTVGAGLLLTGAFSLAIPLSGSFGLIAVALFIASSGNPIYAIANQTALIEVADSSSVGSVMATRFGLVQTASIVGAAFGGVITNQYGAQAAYGLLGVGLLILALYALAAGRSTINPLHGAAYEEALQAKT